LKKEEELRPSVLGWEKRSPLGDDKSVKVGKEIVGDTALLIRWRALPTQEKKNESSKNKKEREEEG